MPEGYVHVRCARLSLRRAGLPPYDIPAVMAGANGPDPLFYYLGLPNHVKLGQRLHAEQCGPFLTALVRRADSRILKGYALGFLSHNATDSTFHPWVAAMTAPDGPYAQPGGHPVLEGGLDCLYLRRDKGRSTVRAMDGVPRLALEKAREIGGAFHDCLRDVYGVKLPVPVLAKCQRDIYRVRHFVLQDPNRWRRTLAAKFEGLPGLGRDMIAGRFQPGTPPEDLPGRWVDPYTGVEHQETVDGLMERAVALGAELMAAAQAYWDGEIGPLELARRVGSRSYMTGLTV